MKKLLISLLITVLSLGVLFAPAYAIERQTFGERYPDVDPTGLVLWLNQTDARSYGDTQNWYNLAGKDWIEQATVTNQPSITGALGIAGTVRDFDGNDNFMHQKEYDDESGATFWPTNAGAAFNATNARFRVAGVDLAAAFASADNDYMLVIHDSADKTGMGYIGVADSAFAVTNDYTSDFSAGVDGWSAAREHTIAGNQDGVSDGSTSKDNCILITSDNSGTGADLKSPASLMDEGKHYRISFSYYIPAGNTNVNGFSLIRPDLLGGPDHIITGTWTDVVPYYLIPDANGYNQEVWVRLEKNGTGNFTGANAADDDMLYLHNLVVDEIINVGTDGVLIMSTKGGATQSWAYQESGIDLNDIDSFEVLKTDFQIKTALSASMWVKPDDGQPGGNDGFISKWRVADGFRSFIFENLTTGKLLVDMSSDGADNAEEETTDDAFFSNGAETWHQVGFAYDGTTCVIYGDGVALASTTGGDGIPATLFDVAEKLTIGAMSTPTEYFAGLVGPVAVFERALTAAEVQRIYNVDRRDFGL